MLSFISLLILIAYRTKRVKNDSLEFGTNKVILGLWITFSLLILITSLVNKENITYAILLCTIIPYFFIYKTQYYKLLRGIVLKAILFSSVLIILNVFGLFNLLSVNIEIKSNSMGIFMLFFSIYVLYKFYHSDIYVVLVLLNLFFILLTNSRTALISYVVTLFIVVVFKIIKSNLAHAFLRIFYTLSTLLLAGLLLMLNSEKIAHLDIVRKFIYFESESNIFNGRDLIWGFILENINLTGHKMEILSNVFNLSPHSNFLGILFNNGLIAFLVFCLINIIMFFQLLKKVRRDSESIFSFIVLLVFILTSITEYYYNVLGIGLVFLWYICIGDMMFNKRSNLIK